MPAARPYVIGSRVPGLDGVVTSRRLFLWAFRHPRQLLNVSATHEDGAVVERIWPSSR
jgi:hypothetical protein